ncbi:MAG: tyrosine-type recombinase/integrase [Gemmataceae bacterium]|nr:tyrosine-type recombinase/integrase [Gemmataceae bacterium]MCI0740186.1 tyrosine-type recombinase/integrase [Gemmataceae bacterium]
MRYRNGWQLVNGTPMRWVKPTKMQGMTVAEIGKWFWERYKCKSEKSLHFKKRIWQLFEAYKPTRLKGAKLANVAVSALIADDLLSFVAKQPRVRADNTMGNWLRSLKQPFHQAEVNGLIQRSPFKAEKTPRGRQGRDLTPEEFRTFIQLAEPSFRRLLFFMRWTGARPNEMARLQWKDVDFAHKTATLKEHKTAHVTGKPRRIFLNSLALKLLLWLKRVAEVEPWRDRGRDSMQSLGARRFVFLNCYGGPWANRAMTKDFALIRDKIAKRDEAAERARHGKKVGKPPRAPRKAVELPKDAKMYGVRHLYATAAICRGVDLLTLSQLMGHENVAMTQRYTHLANKHDHLAAAAERAAGQLSS